MKLSFQKTLILFFAAISIAIVVVSIVVYGCAKASRDTAFWVKHTETVLDEAEQISSLTKDLQFESLGYYFTSDRGFLSPYNGARSEVLHHVEILKNLTADNPSQQKRTHRLGLLISDLITFSDLSIQWREASKGAPRFLGNFQQRKVFRNEIEDLITAIRKEERRLLSVREKANGKSIDFASKLLYVLIGSIFIFLITALFTILYNLNKRKKAEQELRESETRFHLLVNNIKDFAIFMIDSEGKIVSSYSGAEYLKEYSEDEVTGKPITIFYTNEDIQNREPENNLKIAAEKGSYETQGWRVKKDGSKFWADVVFTAIYDEQGKVIGFTKVTRDYTLHKKAEDELKNTLEKEKELSEMKSNFVTMASHEFRTPLTSILSSATLISQYTQSELQDKRERHIKRIKASVANLISILEEFLSLEKIEKGKVVPKFETFNLKELTAGLCGEMKNVAKQGQIFTAIYEGEELVNTDPAFVRLILTNLTSNAIKYSSENCPVTIKTQVADGCITIGVKDNGMGIPKEDQKHLFDRFFRSANVANIQGTGLGLHIIKRYIDVLNGTIDVTSEVGKGSEFTVQIANVKADN